MILLYLTFFKHIVIYVPLCYQQPANGHHGSIRNVAKHVDVDGDVSTENNMEEVIVEGLYHKRLDVTHIDVPANGHHGSILNVAKHVDVD